MKWHAGLLVMFAISASVLIGCGTVPTSVHTTAEARRFIYSDMPISEITAWAGVTPRFTPLARPGSFIPIWYTYQYHLADGELYVLREVGKDGVYRARLFKIEQ